MGSTTNVPSVGNEEREFFVKKARSLVPASFFEEVAKIEKELANYTRRDIIEKYLSLQTKSTKIEPYRRDKYIVKTEVVEALQKGFVSPSMFIKYRRCARELAIEIIQSKKLGGVVVTVEQLRSYLKGILVHKLFYERYAYGETEVRVESRNLGIAGYIDEVREELGTYKIIELKSSYRPDIVGAALQVMSYMYAFIDQNSLAPEQVEGYIVTRRGTYRVLLNDTIFNEYMKRLRKILEIAVEERLEDLPPRLPSKLSSKCETCPYRGLCLSLPDKYRSYSRYFEAMGFKKLVDRKPANTLDKFF